MIILLKIDIWAGKRKQLAYLESPVRLKFINWDAEGIVHIITIKDILTKFKVNSIPNSEFKRLCLQEGIYINGVNSKDFKIDTPILALDPESNVVWVPDWL